MFHETKLSATTMRPLKATGLILLLLLVAAATAHPGTEPATADKAKKYIDAMKELADLIGKGFENAKSLTDGMSGLLGMVSKVIGIVNVLFGLPSSQGKQLQAYFEEVNKNFEKVFIQMDEVKRLISWESARGKYSDDEKDLIAMRLYYDRYLSDPDSEVYKDQFTREYDRRQGAATNLYLGVVAEGQVLLDNLAEASMDYTKNNRRLTTDFLLGLFKLVMQGSMMDVLYYRLKGFNADEREAQWDEKLQTMMNKIDSSDKRLVAAYRDQANEDINEVMRVHGGQGEGTIARTLYNALNSKFYWKKWCVITSKKSNGDNYIFTSYGDARWSRDSHNKRIEITARDKATTINIGAVKGAVTDVSKKAYSVNVVENMRSYFTSGLSSRGQNIYRLSYAIRTLCGGCGLHAAGDAGQSHAQKFVAFWYIGIPAALDGTIAAC